MINKDRKPINTKGIRDHNGAHSAALAARYAQIDRAAVYPDMYQAFQTAANAGKAFQILDIGCGSGDDALAIAQMGHLVTGVDPSDLIDIAKANNNHHNIRYIKDTLPALSELTVRQRYQAAIMSAVAQYIHPDDIVPALSRVSNLMHKGARLYLSYPSPPSRAHQYEISPKDLFNTLRAVNAYNAERGFSPLLIDQPPQSIPDSTGRKSIDGRDIVFHNYVLIKSMKPGVA